MSAHLDRLIDHDRYPRASRYDPEWLLGLDMGPNPLWLLEDLCVGLELPPGALVLDLGSGKGATSVYLAREYGVRVWAADLWVDPDDAAKVFRDAGVGEDVSAFRAEAHTLPFARDTFDAIISVDAFEYFGTADGYLRYLSRFAKPGGHIRVATPALRREIDGTDGIPGHVHEVVGGEALAWHSPEWWRTRWELSGAVTEVEARMQEDGWLDWLRWSRSVAERDGRDPAADPVVRMLEADAGELLGFALVCARRR